MGSAFEFIDVSRQFGVRRIGRKMSDVRLEADLGAVSLLRTDVNRRRSVVADEDHRESGPPKAIRNAGCNLRRLRLCATVQQWRFRRESVRSSGRSGDFGREIARNSTLRVVVSCAT